MKWRSLRSMTSALLAAAWLLATVPAMGQTYVDEVDQAPDQMNWLAVVISIALLVLVGFVSFKSSKRDIKG